MLWKVLVSVVYSHLLEKIRKNVGIIFDKLRTLAQRENFSIEFKTGSSLTSDNMVQSTLRVSIILSK